MVVCGLVIDKRDERKLARLGVRDSKELSPKRRGELAPRIEEVAKAVIIMRVQPCKIDSYRAKGVNLNRIEAMKMAEIIEMCGSKRIYIDAVGINPKRFKEMILELLTGKEVELIVENFADKRYPVVSAASIMAKVERDKAIAEIERKVGERIGVGYSHDPQTIAFVEGLLRKRKKLPPYVRKSWITARHLRERLSLKSIKDFIKKKEKCKGDEGGG
jgi:ribonuclease HII